MKMLTLRLEGDNDRILQGQSFRHPLWAAASFHISAL